MSYGHTLAVLLVLLVSFLFFVFNDTPITSTASQLLLSQLNTTEQTLSCAAKVYGICDPHDPRFYNIILEEEALRFEPCQDINKTASVQHSKLTLKDRVNRTYNIGEEIIALVKLYNGYGKRKHSGGDHLRATLENKKHKASVPCVVTDNRDGTQTVACESLWTGTATINVLLAYTRETITSIYRIRTQVLATRNIYGMFRCRTYSSQISYSEDTICHPNHTYLLKLTNYTELCNMTYINSGMPFYCGKPKDEHLLCQDLELVRTRQPFPELPVTECEDTLLKSGQRALKQTLTVNVQNSNGNDSVSIIDKPSVPCSEYNIALLWQSGQPTGFFYNGEWILRNCLGFHENRYMNCLRNKRLYLFGDSTNRQWYTAIMKRFKCPSVTEKWDFEKWHKDAECYNKRINFKAGWYPHAQPFYVGEFWDDAKYTLYSISRRIDNIPRTEHAIVIIHCYLHFVSFHHSVFKQRIEIIRNTVEMFLANNKHSIVMIKAPHTFEDSSAGRLRINDYFGYVYSKILYEEFEGLHDRVVLLNNRDTTIAQHVKWNHPPDNVVNAMIDQMLSFACDR
ncbi:NXPE family member 4-like [Mercenaria mercenaria]|uniref:NXPE family member 4-like n=1 Tax=Mercenaria mercenaria TaxID=6596 RepID=UPI00234FAD97|nr:NXPE family member 4-like [Mercenaria mercenaria]